MHQRSSQQQTFSLSRPDEEVTLLELADRLLHRGVVVTGEATISVAGVDLIYLGLNVVLTGVENLRRAPPTRDSAD
jgi:gas vesicle structural protein